MCLVRSFGALLEQLCERRDVIPLIKLIFPKPVFTGLEGRMTVVKSHLKYGIPVRTGVSNGNL